MNAKLAEYIRSIGRNPEEAILTPYTRARCNHPQLVEVGDMLSEQAHIDVTVVPMYPIVEDRPIGMPPHSLGYVGICPDCGKVWVKEFQPNDQ